MKTIYRVYWTNESGTNSFCELKNDDGSYKGSVEAFETSDIDEARKVYSENLESYKGLTVRELGYCGVCENSSDKGNYYVLELERYDIDEDGDIVDSESIEYSEYYYFE